MTTSGEHRRAKDLVDARMLERWAQIAGALGISLARLDRAQEEIETLCLLVYRDALDEASRPPPEEPRGKRADWEERPTDRPLSGDRYPAAVDPAGERFRDPRRR